MTFLFLPLVSAVPAAATAPALIIVGVLLMQDVVDIRFKDLTIAIPAFLMIIGMPVSFNIATGFGFGFIAYVVLMAAQGRWRELSPTAVLIAAAFVVNFALR